MYTQFLTIFLPIFFQLSLQNYIIDLTSNWTLLNFKRNISIHSINLPASVHTILKAQRLIPDPLYGFNDTALRWIAKETWLFRNEFMASPNQSQHEFSLHFESVDTVAFVYLNQQLIASTDNQFLKYKINNLALDQFNSLEIRLVSAIDHAQQLANVYSYRIPPECPLDVQHGECHVNFIRKQQCSFSWDWGPALAPIGLNGPIYLTQIDSFDFDFSLSVYSNQDMTEWTLDIEVRIEMAMNLNSSGIIFLKIDDLKFLYKWELILNRRDNSPDELILNLKLKLNTEAYPITLWWPSGQGEQKLYNFSVQIELDEQNKIKKSKQIGFRKIELVQSNLVHPHGLTFFFRINLRSVFLKGSNWIPADAFQELVDVHYLRWLLGSAKSANMNVLRVWGGGVYEQEVFYQLADEMGILIWQDFMFACATYPTNAEFLSNVKSEVEYQVNRLRHHTSILVWAANNENEAALSTNWFDTNTNKTLYANDYRRLYIDTIMSAVSALDPDVSRPFLSSSPTNGLESQAENWLAKDPYDKRFGDLHFYDYKMNGWNWRSFPLPRFMSEFGVQSLPSFSSLSDAYPMPDEANWFGRLNEHRQHHAEGNRQILDEIQNNLRLPSSVIDERVSQFKALIYLSQINQAMHLRTGSEFFRRSRNFFDSQTGQGLCMGTMYWQFNDLWQAPTWSSIEFVANEQVGKGGKWKMAHYFIKKSYADFILSPILNKTKVEIYAVSDLSRKVSGEFKLSLFSFSQVNTPVYTASFNFSIGPLRSRPVLSIDVDALEAKSRCAVNSTESCLLLAEWNVFGESDSNFMLFNNQLANVTNLKPANLRIERVQEFKSGFFEIELSTDQVALFVWLDVETSRIFGTFSDNGFHMTESRRVVTYRVQSESNAISEDEMKELLSVQTLANLY